MFTFYKKTSIFFTFFILFFFATSSFGVSTKDKAFVIAVDAGHGGHDAGTQFENVKESSLTLNMALELLKIHENYTNSSSVTNANNPTNLNDPNLIQPIQLKLIRTHNRYVSLSSRLEKAQQLKADLFVSLHVNSSPTSVPEGVEIYFNDAAMPFSNSEVGSSPQHLSEEGRINAKKFSHKNENTNTHEKEHSNEELHDTHQKIVESTKEISDLDFIVNELKSTTKWKKSLVFAKSTQKQIKSNMKNTKSVIKKEAFYVLNNSSMPSILLELGFLSNPVDREKLLSEEYRKSLLNNVYKAIINTSINLQNQKDSL